MSGRAGPTSGGLYRKRRKRKDGTVHESPTWWCRFRVGGREYNRSTGEVDRRKAARVARAIRARVEADAPARAHVAGLTYAQLAEWDKGSRRLKGVSTKQLEAVDYLWSRLLRFFGRRDPRRIDYGQVVAYVQGRLEEVTGQTIRRELHALRRGLTEARRRHHHIPRLEDWPEVPTSPPDPRQAGSYHEPAILLRWLRELREPSDPTCRPDPLAAIQAEFILRTGLRVTEARQATLSWVEERGGAHILRVPAKVAKTRRARTIALTPEAVALLVEAYELRGPAKPLFPSDHKKAFRGASRRIGYRRITPRDLRHCYATLSTMSGDVVATQAALGHADLRTTSRYLHATDERTTVASEAVAAALGGDPSTGLPPGWWRPWRLSTW